MKETQPIDTRIINEKIISRLPELYDCKTDTESYQQGVDLIKQGYLPFVVSNHQSLGDGPVLIHLSEQLITISDGQIRGIYLVIADSLSEGRQNLGAKEAFQTFLDGVDNKEWLSLVNVPYLLDEKPKLLSSGLRKILKAPKDRCIVNIFPEGRTQGGRRKNPNTEEIYGIIEPPKKGIDGILNKYIKHNEKFFVWPISISRSYLAFNPNTYELDLNFKQNLFSNQKFEPLAEVHFSTPILSPELIEQEDKTNYIMSKISQNLPESERGVFSTISNRTNL